ncbi:MAG: triphosphoribosyl-dephospho-CoA synthase, partial [Planctomycetes bacterium]|nr:triphosphoribosyl-dephospho-CoA synthase [Planctomycetota bacterium]
MNMESHHVKILQSSIQTACFLEATARKPGNVHPGASFEDLTYDDFLRSANV